MNSKIKLNILIVLFSLFANTYEDINVTEVMDNENHSNHTTATDVSSNGRSMRDNTEKSLRSDDKNRESLRKEKDMHQMYDILRLHHSVDHDFKETKTSTDVEKKDKGKLQTVGGVVGEIIAVIVSEVVKLFGNMVSDVAREVTAHGFVSIFKQFTDLTGISLPEIAL